MNCLRKPSPSSVRRRNERLSLGDDGNQGKRSAYCALTPSQRSRNENEPIEAKAASHRIEFHSPIEPTTIRRIVNSLSSHEIRSTTNFG
jgi:hypothetical protein